MDLSPADQAAFEAYAKRAALMPDRESFHNAMFGWQAAIAYERERAAKVCEAITHGIERNTRCEYVGGFDDATERCADEIRKGPPPPE